MKLLKQIPDTFGAPYEGGYYGGKIKIGPAIFAILWAPKAEGEIVGTVVDAPDHDDEEPMPDDWHDDPQAIFGDPRA